MYGNTDKEGAGDDYYILLDSEGRIILAGRQIDDAAFTPATDSVLIIGAFADETAPDSVDEGNGGAVRMSLDRMLLVQASGRAADGAAAAGNPVRAGGVYNATIPAVDDGAVVSLLTDIAGRLKIVNDVGVEVTALASAARIATTQSSDLVNPGAKGVILTLDVTAITDTPSITVNIEYKDPVGGNYETIFSAAAAVTATGVHTYLLYPDNGIAAADDIVEVVKLPLPRTWRVNVTHGDADSITYSISGSYLT